MNITSVSSVNFQRNYNNYGSRSAKAPANYINKTNLADSVSFTSNSRKAASAALAGALLAGAISGSAYAMENEPIVEVGTQEPALYGEDFDYDTQGDDLEIYIPDSDSDIDLGDVSEDDEVEEAQKTPTRPLFTIVDDGEKTTKYDYETGRILREVDNETGDRKYYVYFDSSNLYTISYVRPDDTRYLLELYSADGNYLFKNDTDMPKVTFKDIDDDTPIEIPEFAQTNWAASKYLIKAQREGENPESYTIVDKNVIRYMPEDAQDESEAIYYTLNSSGKIEKEESNEEFLNAFLNIPEGREDWGTYRYLKHLAFDTMEYGSHLNPYSARILDQYFIILNGEIISVDENGNFLGSEEA